MNPVYIEAGYEQCYYAGRGAYGQIVILKRWKDNSKCVAKEVRLTGLSEKEQNAQRREALLLSQLNHPNIIKYIDSFQRGNILYLIAEYCEGGDLQEAIDSQEGKYFDESQILGWFVQLCLALKYLHDRRILHRDIKSPNVFLSRNWMIVKLGDFGFSTKLDHTDDMARTVCGTPAYFSPELCRGEPYNNKCDVWALGCLLYHLCSLKFPFVASSVKGISDLIINGTYNPLPSHFSISLKSLVDSLLRKDQIKRPSINEVLNSPFVWPWLPACTEALMPTRNNNTEIIIPEKKDTPEKINISMINPQINDEIDTYDNNVDELHRSVQSVVQNIIRDGEAIIPPGTEFFDESVMSMVDLEAELLLEREVDEVLKDEPIFGCSVVAWPQVQIEVQEPPEDVLSQSTFAFLRNQVGEDTLQLLLEDEDSNDSFIRRVEEVLGTKH